MREKIKKLFLIILFFSFLFPISFKSLAQEIKITGNTASSESAKVSYQLAWPGMLPDNPFYKLKVIRNKIIGRLVFNPFKKIEFNLLQADKTLYASKLLVDNGNTELAKEIALKGENYMTQLVSDYRSAYWRHQNIPQELDLRIKLATEKHQQLLDGIIKKVKAEDKKTFLDVKYFSELNYETLVKFKQEEARKR